MRTTRRTIAAAGMAAALAVTGGVAAVAANSQDAPPKIAFVANGRVPADALAAGPIAGQLGAPIYTTEQHTLSPEAESALQGYDPELVIVLGGPVAIDGTVVDQIEAVTGLSETDTAGADGGVVRAAGENRFATATAVAGLLAEYDPAFLQAGGAVDADTVDGMHADAFARAGSCTAGQVVTGTDGNGNLTCASDQTDGGDADTVDGLDADAFARAGSCTAGQVVTGTDGNGNLTCASDQTDGGDADTVDGQHASDLLWPATLPSGRTLTGVFDITHSGGDSAETGYFSEAVSFPIPLDSDPVYEIIEQGEPSTSNCPGTAADPQAAPGYLCAYESWGSHDGVDLAKPSTNSVGIVGKRGFSVKLTRNNAASSAVSRGSWAVTAP